MRLAHRLADVEAVDRLLMREKHLSGEVPEFGPSENRATRSRDDVAVWPLEDEIGVGLGADIRIEAKYGDCYTICLIFNGEAVARLDCVPENVCERNPVWSKPLGAEKEVCGPHLHRWSDNRQHILTQDRWHLPCRRKLPPQVRRFPQALASFAKEINLTLTSEQRAFCLPEQLL